MTKIRSLCTTTLRLQVIPTLLKVDTDSNLVVKDDTVMSNKEVGALKVFRLFEDNSEPFIIISNSVCT